jgi:kynureninase
MCDIFMIGGAVKALAPEPDCAGNAVADLMVLGCFIFLAGIDSFQHREIFKFAASIRHHMQFENSLDYARSMDRNDPVAGFRDEYHLLEDKVYLCGNSLGLMPKRARAAVEQEFADWEKYGVEGHFDGKNPWFHYHKFLAPMTARLVGAKENEVVVMNNLTVNLHLLMVSFYRPAKQRFKIIMEGGAFPSDQYAIETQVRFHGYDPSEAIIEIFPREGELHLRTEDILKRIHDTGDSLALVLFGGVNYYTGQAFDMAAIAKAAHNVNAYAGFDLAHAAGNLHLKLHEWDADFACWCSYKYLNSGPGGTSGIFIHERNASDTSIPRFGGWWGHDEASRFQMKKGFKPMPTAEGWQLSNAQVFPMAIHKASLELFDKADMQNLREKSVKLTGYLEYVLRKIESPDFSIITPAQPDQRGCQLSLLFERNGKAWFDRLSANNIIADWREPNVIRMSPVPMYNTFEDVYRVGEVMNKR